MPFIDYYKILGVEKKATADQIKKRYRKLARKYHPDLNMNDKKAERKFKEINEANEVLSNVKNRKKYDSYGKDWKHSEEFEKAKQQNSYRSQNVGDGTFSDGDYSQFFESLFGGGFSRAGRGSVKFRGKDFNAELKLDLKDVFTTRKQNITVNGKNILLTIPAGLKNGQVLKIKGHGGKGSNGGPDGDLLISILIKNNSRFQRHENDLYTAVELDLYHALLGGEITVDTFDGKVKLKVKPETQNGTKVKLKGKGFPVFKKDGEFGNLYITFTVKLPTNLTNEEKKLFNELSRLRVL